MKKITILLAAAAVLFLLAAVPAAADYTVSAGDELKITGQVQGSPGYLNYYIFGTNYFTQGKVSADDAEYTIKFNTKGLATGEYIIVIQHPMYDKLFNVQVTNTGNGLTGKVFATNGSNKLEPTPQDMSSIDTRQSANAAYALESLINLEYHDDAYIEEKIIITGPALVISSGDGTVIEGDDFTITGTTNVKPGTIVTVEISSAAFAGVAKTGTSDSAFLTLKCPVTAGYDGVNHWSVTAKNPRLLPGEYRITATTPNNGPTDSGKFTVIEKTAVPPQPVQTAQTTSPTTTTPVTESVHTAVPASPGFGIFACAAGLAAAAAVLRRK